MGLLKTLAKMALKPHMSAEDVGEYGEGLTARKLRRFMRRHAPCRMVSNLYVPADDGRTTEIDLVLITTRGLFVIESKNYSGWIFGNESHRQWAQCLKGGAQYRFYNPIWQNRGHLNHLSDFLDEPVPLYSLIVFSERCELKDVTVHGADVVVVKRDGLEAALGRLYNDAPRKAIDPEQVELIYNQLRPLTQASRRTKREHKADVRAAQASNSKRTKKKRAEEDKPGPLKDANERSTPVEKANASGPVRVKDEESGKPGPLENEGK